MNKLFVTFILALLALTAQTSGSLSEEPFNPESDPIDEMALNGLNQYLTSQNLSLQFVEVLSCKKQLVAGKNYYLTLKMLDSTTNTFLNYETVIYVVPWEKTAKVTEFVKQQEQEQGEKKDGGYKEFNWYSNDKETEEIKLQAKNLLEAHLIEQNLPSKNYTVQRAELQVVSGVNVRVLVQLEDGSVYQAVIYMQIWTKTYKVTSFEKQQQGIQKIKFVEQQKQDQKLVGGMEQIDFAVEEQVFKDFIYEHLQLKLSQEQNLDVKQIDVQEAYKQVVSGVRYVLVFEVDNGNKYKADFVIQLWKKSIEFNYFQQI